jgi:PKD repeat protein
MDKGILVPGIIFLFMVSALIPMTLGYKIIKQPSAPNEDIILNIGISGSPPVANFTIYNDSSIGIVEFDGSLSYDLDGEIISYEWDYGDGTIGDGKYGWHQYCIIGTYYVTLTVTDNDGLNGNLTKSVNVLLANIPPPTTEINGPPSGIVGTEYEYTFRIWYTDAEVFLLIDWGDGNTTGWIGPYNSLDFVTLAHSWSEKGTYIIKAKAKDFCREGPWGTLSVTMPVNHQIRQQSSSNQNLLGSLLLQQMVKANRNNTIRR